MTKLYGVFGPEDKILDAGITLDQAKEIRRNFQSIAFCRLRNEDHELPFSSLDEMLKSEMGVCYSRRYYNR